MRTTFALVLIAGLCVASASMLKIEDIQDRYLITLKSECHHDSLEEVLESTIESEYGLYLNHMNVYIVKTPKVKIAEAVAANTKIHPSGLSLASCIERIEEDAIRYLEDTPTEKSTAIPVESETSNVHTEFDIYYAWHLDRINARSGLDHNSTSPLTSSNAVDVYIVDSGIDRQHVWLSSKCASADSEHYVAFADDDTCGFYACDQNTHGTHVSGLVASNTYGYNPNATLHAVKVFNSTGQTSNSVIFTGLNWVLAHKSSSTPSVVNMSLGGGYDYSSNHAVTTLVHHGVHTLVAAGNETTDACTKSPASAPAVLTIGSSNDTDAISWFSNYGTCVDFYAPGTNILSTLPNNYVGYKSGTSMATPVTVGYVSAVAAYYGSSASVNRVQNAVKHLLTTDVITGSNAGSNNDLLYGGAVGSSSAAVEAASTEVSQKAAVQSTSYVSYALMGLCLATVVALYTLKKRNQKSGDALLEENYGKMI